MARITVYYQDASVLPYELSIPTGVDEGRVLAEWAERGWTTKAPESPAGKKSAKNDPAEPVNPKEQ